MRFKCEPVYKAPGGERLLGEFYVDAVDHEAARTQAKAQVWAVLRLTENCLGPSGDDIIQDIHDCIAVAVNEDMGFHEFQATHEDGSPYAKDLGRKLDDMRDAARELVEDLDKRAESAKSLRDGVPIDADDSNVRMHVRLLAKAQTYEHAAELTRAALGVPPKGA